MIATLFLTLVSWTACMEPPEIPAVGRPVDWPFSGAQARFIPTRGPEAVLRSPFAMQTTADPVIVDVGGVIDFTLTIRCLGQLLTPPDRLDLRQLPSIDSLFHVEDLPESVEQDPGRPLMMWAWKYRLRPRRAGITEIPGIPFTFHNPDVKPDAQSFQTLWSDAIPVKVTPAQVVSLPVEALPDMVRLRSEADMRPRPRLSLTPTPFRLALTLLAPPLLFLAWLTAGRWLKSSGDQPTAWRSSRAASNARRAIREAARLSGRDQAERCHDALIAFLRERLKLSLAEPTAQEVGSFLANRLVPVEITEQIQRAIQDLDRERFAPTGAEVPIHLDHLLGLVERIEGLPC